MLDLKEINASFHLYGQFISTEAFPVKTPELNGEPVENENATWDRHGRIVNGPDFLKASKPVVGINSGGWVGKYRYMEPGLWVDERGFEAGVVGWFEPYRVATEHLHGGRELLSLTIADEEISDWTDEQTRIAYAWMQSEIAKSQGEENVYPHQKPDFIQ